MTTAQIEEARECQSCGAPLTRRQGTDWPESWAAFRKRRFCSRDCHRDAVRRAAQNQPHGTDSWYRRGCRCEECRAFNSKRCADWVRRQGDIPEGVTHGLSAYGNWGCRCDVCSAAAQQANHLLYRRIKDGLVPHTRGGRLTSCPCSDCRDYAANVLAPRLRAENDASRDVAHHHGDAWTGAEMEIAARGDLTAKQVAEMLGRTVVAVGSARRRMRREPKYRRVLGAQT